MASLSAVGPDGSSAPFGGPRARKTSSTL